MEVAPSGSASLLRWVTATSAPNGEKFINTRELKASEENRRARRATMIKANPRSKDPLARINLPLRAARMNYRSFARRSRYICHPIIINNQAKLERQGQPTTKDGGLHARRKTTTWQAPRRPAGASTLASSSSLPPSLPSSPRETVYTTTFESDSYRCGRQRSKDKHVPINRDRIDTFSLADAQDIFEIFREFLETLTVKGRAVA